MVQLSGWPENASGLFFIAIVREYTAVGLWEAKVCLERLRAGETLELCVRKPGQEAAFVEKLLRFEVVQKTQIGEC
jgi:hypothetical protein